MRRTRDPYRTWIAEVILQQTRMDQGLPYLHEFLEAFPDVQALASAPADEVLRLWQGLGYYSRARNLHASARYIVEQLDGVMPGDYQGLLALKGVGKYTAAAIASWCYNEARPAVDGNVSRVIARLFGIREAVNTPSGEKLIYKLAAGLLDHHNPGRHNQAMIEFGALQCVPVSPRCSACPLQEKCEAFMEDRVDRIPLKQKNKEPVERWFYYCMPVAAEETVLVQRDKKDIWEGLYEFPLLESDGPLREEGILERMLPDLLQGTAPPGDNGASGGTAALKETMVLNEHEPGWNNLQTVATLSAPFRHQLSHQTIHARFLQVRLDRLPAPLPEKWQAVPLEKLDRYAMPRLIQRYLESVKI